MLISIVVEIVLLSEVPDFKDILLKIRMMIEE